MNHISYEEWLPYIRDDLDENLREQYEDHLYDCHQCLMLYAEAVEAAEINMSMMTEETALTEEIMQVINEKKKKQLSSLSKQTNVIQKEAVHYIVAAAMTLILMLSGTFTHLIHAVNQFETQNKNESSIVSGLMETSFSIIGKVENEIEEDE